tara:strand:+ start:3396 stop:6848 length:3453 start_codon:yes stop_codon:yes gene_type:complete
MHNGIEDKISLFVKDQLPEFYHSDGPMFTAFIEAYYEWLETQPTSVVARNLIEYHDIDQTTAQFLDYFKSTFLDGFPGSFKADTQITLKNILDFYKSKGTPRSIELLFRILFDDTASIAYPSQDVLRLSNADYIRPTYIEVRADSITTLVSLEQKEIVGATSGAKAFVESIATRLINNIKVHVMYLSNVRGQFTRTEVVAPTDTGLQDDMPVVVGSLSAIDITLGGKDYAVGDTFDIQANSGKQGKIRVRETADATGLINFNLANGGFGFSTNTEFTETIVNDQNLLTINKVNAAQTYSNTTVSIPTAYDWHEKRIDNAEFFRFETVDQKLETLSYLSALHFNQVAETLIAANTEPNPYVIGVDASNNLIANGYIIDTNINGANGLITIAPLLGTFGPQLGLTIAKAVATHSFEEKEEVHEESDVQLSFISKVGTFNVGDTVQSDVPFANGIISAVNSTVITVNGSFGAWTAGANGNVQKASNTAVTANVVTVNIVTSGANAVITDVHANGTFISVADITGTFNNGKKIKGVKTNAIATLQANPASQGVSDLYLSGNTTANSSVGLRAIVDTYANTSIRARVLGSNSTQIGFANTRYANNLAGKFTANTAAPIIGRDSNTYANVTVVSTGSGAAFEISTLENTEAITIYTDFVGENNTANVGYLDCVIDGGNSGIGFLNDVEIDAGGTGYSVGETLIFDLGGPGGGQPTTNATATISAIGAGGVVTGIQVATAGAGFYSNSTANTTNLNGNGLQVTGDFDYGYGFPKDPNGDYTTVLDNVLSRFSGTIGTIAALGNINPGNNYSSDPFTAVYTSGIAKYDRKDLVVNIINKNGEFTIGENVNQTVTQAGQVITLSSNTGPFVTGESLVQYHTATTADPVIKATGEIYTATATTVTVNNVRLKTTHSNGFMTISTSNTTPFQTSNGVIGQLSAQTGVVSAVSVVSQTQTAKGQVYAQTEDSVSLRRLSFSVGFNDAPGNFIFGSSSGANGNITSIYEDDLTRPIGDNALITAKTQAANGIVTSVDIIDSGFGYQHDAKLTLVSANTQKNIVVSGTANVTTTGIGEGYWADEESFLNTKYIHDNDYYQSHSYVVESGLSLDKYREVLLQVAHVAGTKLFGQVKKETLANTQMGLSNSHVITGTTSGGVFTAS